MYGTRICFLLGSCALLAGSVASGSTPPSAATARQALRGLPLYFEPNQGQWNPQVKFSARAGDGRVFLTGRGVELSVSGSGAEAPRVAGISLLNSNRSPVAAGLEQLPGRSSYFLGNDPAKWRKDVSHFARVRYDEVYPGIDVVYYGNQNQLEYDFILHPGADPGRIRLKFQGAGRLSLNAEGDLVLEQGGVRLVQKRPNFYQQTPDSALRRQVSGQYKLVASNVVAVEVGPYDRSQPLTVDPVVVYASYLGGGMADVVTSVKVDSSGMVYVYGYTNNSDLVATSGAYLTANAGQTDLFLAKFDPTQSGASSLIYFSYIGGTGTEIATGMALDSSGNVYLTGSTTSTTLPMVGSPFQNALVTTATTAGTVGKNAFIIKFRPNGQGTADLVYSTYLGGSGVDQGNDIALDASGAVYVVGTTTSGDFPRSASAYAAARWGVTDSFITKLVPGSSTLAYSSFLGGELDDDGRAIAVTPGGMIYIAGTTSGTEFPLAGNSYQTTLQGLYGIFVAQIDPTQYGVNSLIYSTYISASVADEARGMALDPSGNLLLTGYTMSPDFPVTSHAAQSKLGGNADAFVASVNPAAPPSSFINYATFLGGQGGDAGEAIASDSQGNAFVTGYTMSVDFPVTSGALQTGWGYGVDIFLAELSPTGGLLYSTYMGLTGVNVGYAIAVGQDGSVYLGGSTQLEGLTITPNAFQTDFGGGSSDGFLVVISGLGSADPAAQGHSSLPVALPHFLLY
ncbi:MAG: SBBP repeat-containing protein [Bryobacteraceae bacterium]